MQHVEFADYSAFDLDPSEGVPFEKVLDVARWIRDELDTLGAVGVAKTSGSDGLHIYVPLPPGTPYDAGMLYCQIVAAVVAQKHPAVATTERMVAARGKRVYIDCLQNILGKTLATAYSARASEYCRRVHAGDVAGDRRRVRSPGVHDRHRAGALRQGRGPVGGVAEGERAWIWRA